MSQVRCPGLVVADARFCSSGTSDRTSSRRFGLAISLLETEDDTVL